MRKSLAITLFVLMSTTTAQARVGNAVRAAKGPMGSVGQGLRVPEVPRALQNLRSPEAMMMEEKVSIRGDGEFVEISDGDRALVYLEGRVATAEVSPGNFNAFARALNHAQSTLGFELLAGDAVKCMREYPPKLVQNFMALVVSTEGALSVSEAFGAMVSRAGELFPTSRLNPSERICGLAGRGYNCQLLNPKVCAI